MLESYFLANPSHDLKVEINIELSKRFKLLEISYTKIISRIMTTHRMLKRIIIKSNLITPQLNLI